MRSINILIKTTNQCNMRCKYCFHEKYGYSDSYLDLNVFEKTINMLASDYDHINIIWHGGEPLLSSLEFFENAYSICNANQGSFSFSIQTNATLLEEKSILFFKNNNTKIGISFDGLCNENTRGNTELILNNISLLKKFDCNVGAILVATQRNVNNLIQEYEYFKKLEIGLKINPLFSDGAAIQEKDLFLNVDDYINQIILLYKYWVKDTDCRINVSNFKILTNLIVKNRSNICTFNSCLGKWLCLDVDGSVYPCDRLCTSDFLLGNINNISNTVELFDNENFKNLIKKSIIRRNACIDNCEYYKMCYGGCNANALLYGDLTNVTNSNFCKIQKGLIKGIKQELLDVNTNTDKTKYNPYFLNLL